MLNFNFALNTYSWLIDELQDIDQKKKEKKDELQDQCL